MRTGLRLTALATVLLTLTALPLVSPAHANRGLVTGVTTPDENGGDQVGFDRVRETGASMTRVILNWSVIAPDEEPESWDPTDPEDPNYNWQAYDDAIIKATNSGLQVLASIYQAPAWAERCRNEIPGICNPDPVMFGQFAEAAARRYQGGALPRVRFWKAWNEPNLFLFFMPQFKNGRKVSPQLYRAMLNRFAQAVRGVDPSNRVVGGGLAPLERPGGLGPLDFMRRLTCLQGRQRPTPQPGCTARVSFDIWANNPYTTGGPTHTSAGIDDASLGDLGKVAAIARAGKRFGKVSTSLKAVDLWVTEFSWDSKGPDPGGVPMSTLRNWVPRAMHQAWKAGFSRFFWLSVRDWPRPPGLPYSQTIEAGLYFRGADTSQDRAKPFIGTFRFPFVGIRRPRGIEVWGRTASSRPGRLVIRYRFGGGWRRIGVVRATAQGVFRGFLRTSLGRGNRGQVEARVISGAAAGAPGQKRSMPFSLRPVRNYYQPPFG